jgi:hypothetical protein
MSVREQLRDELADVGARVPGHRGDLEAIKQRGRRHRMRRQTAGVLAAVALLASGGLLVHAVTAPAPPPTPIIRDVGTPGEELSMRICEAPVGVCPVGASAGDLAALRDALADDPDVHRAEFLGQDAMVTEYEERFAADPELLTPIDMAALPSIVRVTLLAGADPAAFTQRYLDVVGVGEIVPPRLDRPRIDSVVQMEEEYVLVEEGATDVDPDDPPSPGLRWDDARQGWIGIDTFWEVQVDPVPSANAYAVLVDGVPRGESRFQDHLPATAADNALRFYPEDVDAGDELTVVALIESELPPPQSGPRANLVDPRIGAAVVSPPSEPVTFEPTASDD